jgi:hypothetical protein
MAQVRVWGSAGPAPTFLPHPGARPHISQLLLATQCILSNVQVWHAGGSSQGAGRLSGPPSWGCPGELVWLFSFCNTGA